MKKYLEEFSVYAGSLNHAPNNIEGKEKNILVEYVNIALKDFLSEEEVTYHRELLNHVSITEYMIAMLQNPKKFWHCPTVVYEDLAKTQRSLNELINLDIRVPQDFDIKLILEKYISVDLEFIQYHPGMYILITNFLQAYVNLVIAFYQKLRTRAEELKKPLNIDDTLSYIPKENFFIFFEIYNYLIQRVKDIRHFDVNYQDINYIISNTNLMIIIVGILNNEKDLQNYDRYYELCETYPEIKYDEPYIRDWIYSLERENKEGIVLN